MCQKFYEYEQSSKSALKVHKAPIEVHQCTGKLKKQDSKCVIQIVKKWSKSTR